MSDFKIETVGLSKQFKHEKVLNKVSIHVRKNKIYGLLGPNGAGKSTLLKMLVGIIKPSGGQILIDSSAWSRDNLTKMGSLIEQPPLYDNLSAWDNLKVRAYILDLPDSRINEVLQIVGLAQTKNKLAGKFSLGMKQRLGIALALLAQPEILILDEPTNGLDPVGIQEFRELIKGFSQQGITVIISSHILSEIAQIADDIGIISHGRLGYEGANDGGDLEELFMKIIHEHGTKEMEAWQ